MNLLTELELFAKQKMKEHGIDYKFKWTKAKRAAGVCSFTKKEIRVSSVLATARGLEKTKQTILHEIAHALAGKRGDFGHGWIWKQEATKLGVQPDRCFQMSREEKQQVQYKYTGVCPVCGYEQAHHSRKWKHERSCAKCDSTGYNPRYKLTERQNY